MTNFLIEHGQTLGILLAAVTSVGTLIWGIYKFSIRREHEPRIQFDIKAKVIDIHNKHAVVLIKLSLNNKGAVPLKIYEFSTKVKGFLATDALSKQEIKINPKDKSQYVAIDGTINFNHELYQSSSLPANWNYTFIRPNVVQNYERVISVPLTMRYIKVNGRFFYGILTRTIHTAETVIKIEAPK